MSLRTDREQCNEGLPEDRTSTRATVEWVKLAAWPTDYIDPTKAPVFLLTPSRTVILGNIVHDQQDYGYAATDLEGVSVEATDYAIIHAPANLPKGVTFLNHQKLPETVKSNWVSLSTHDIEGLVQRGKDTLRSPANQSLLMKCTPETALDFRARIFIGLAADMLRELNR